MSAPTIEQALAYIRNSPEKESLVIAHIEMGGAGWTSETLAPLNGMRPTEFLRAVYEEDTDSRYRDLHETFETAEGYRLLAEKFARALRDIDTHIRSTQAPVPYIAETLLEALPEYHAEKDEVKAEVGG